jgi:hypothetical protein
MVGSPNTSTTQDNFLFGTICASAADCWAVGYYDLGNGVTQTLTLRYTSNVPTPTSAVSRKTHGNAGTFDIDLPLVRPPGIECRSGGANKDYAVVFKFPSAVTFSSATATPASGGTGSVSSTSTSADGTEVTVDLTGVSNAQKIRITLSNVSNGTGNGDVSIFMGMLLGDVDATGRVDAADVSLVRQQTLQTVTSSNFREDVNASGRIDAADVSIVRQQTLTSLP